LPATTAVQSQANLRFQTSLDTSRGLGFDWSLTPLTVRLAF
jgi:hypothetical protein